MAEIILGIPIKPSNNSHYLHIEIMRAHAKTQNIISHTLQGAIRVPKKENIN